MVTLYSRETSSMRLSERRADRGSPLKKYRYTDVGFPWIVAKWEGGLLSSFIVNTLSRTEVSAMLLQSRDNAQVRDYVRLRDSLSLIHI